MNQHDKNIEENVIGVLISYPQNLLSVTSILKSDYLYSNEPKVVYQAILNLFKEGVIVSLSTVATELKRQGQLEFVGGAYYLSSITRGADVNAGAITYNCFVLHELYILRELSILGTEISNAALTVKADCFEIIDRVNKRTAELADIKTEKVKIVGDVIHDWFGEANKILDGESSTGLMSGLKNVDKRTGGWQKGNLVVIAARPAMGKTAFALALAKHPAIDLKKPTAIFSLEMNSVELAGRLMSSESNVNSTDINQKKISRSQLQIIGEQCNKLIEAPIYIDDTPGISISELRTKAKKLFYEHKIELIVVDYLQKMRGNKKSSREQEISEISGGLKDLARELNIPVIALAQLNRAVEDRPDKRPMLRDLRDSGSIEQDADIVGFLFRPDYYNLFPNGYPYRNEILETKNLMMFHIAKGRGLQIGELPLRFNGEFMQVKDYPLQTGLTSSINEDEFLPINN